MKTGYRTAMIVAAIVVTLSAQALAQPRDWGRGPWPGRPGGPGMMRGTRPFGGPVGTGPGGPGLWGAALPRLDLSSEQKEKIRDIMADSRTDAQKAREAVGDAQRALQDAVADGAGEEQIHAAADKLAQALAHEAVLRSKAMTSVRNVLTEEQAAQMERFKERAGQFRERMRGGQVQGRAQRDRNTRPPARAERGRRVQGPGRQGPPPQFDSRSRLGRSRGGRGSGPWSGGMGRMGRQRPTDAPGPQGRGPLPLGRMFEKADTNEDGLLSRAEMEAFRDEIADRPGFQRR